MMVKVILILQVLTFPFLGLSQSSISLEQRALEFFCTTYKGYEELMDTKVLFNEKTNAESSRVYDVAHCFGEINLLTYQEGERLELDSLDLLKHTAPPKNLSTCGDLKKSTFCWKKKYLSNVYQSRSYIGNKEVVEITLFHKATGQLIICAVLFENEAIVDHCFESIIIN
ncbi:MAG: hypothetical protein ACRBG0_23880 [Lewinella sp.]|uniref:hypothetical protein n=1 Tax=Lewinella sp. TaxID=2004506 RepID=UPI003D6A84B4